MKKIFRPFGFALNGIRHCFVTQVNLRIHLLIALLVTGSGIVLSISITEWMITALCIGLVVTAELINTAIEKLCDVFTTDIHPAIKLVKDVSAGAVLVMALVSCVVGAIIFLPKLISIL
jgi:diacylglycerol kinase